MVLFYALLGGVLPALLWLFFWLHEDKKRPEPRGKIIATFIAGMASVLFVLPVEHYIQDIGIESILLLFLLWAFVEETAKYVFARFSGLRGKDLDEPIDAIIYMITAALGFAALENTLFLISPIGEGLLLESIITGNMRFIGATVLHTVASGIVGVCIAFSFYRKRLVKVEYVVTGIVIATVLHALFNSLIINTTKNGIFTIFAGVWIGIAILIALFERVKRIKRY